MYLRFMLMLYIIFKLKLSQNVDFYQINFFIIFLKGLYLNIFGGSSGIVVSIRASQALDPGSNPGYCIS